METGDLDPGESADLNVDLAEDGDFEIYCPVGDHRGMGMEGTITVGERRRRARRTDETTTDEDSGYRY